MDKYKWTFETVRDGLERFSRENGHYPTALEIDKSSFLPSSRQIQRRFGGLINFRKLAGHNITDFGSGSGRSNIAFNAGKRGLEGEKVVEKDLVKHFGEEFVHIEKRYGDSKQRVDFFIYNPKNDFGIDVITPSSLHSLIVNINMKIPKYLNFPNELYFVIVGNKVTQTELDNLLRNKRSVLFTSNMHLVCFDTFQKIIDSYPRYTKCNTFT